MNIFYSASYKTLLRDEMTRRKASFGARFTYQGAAAAAGIQKTYLSKVFADKKTHLSEDQLFKVLRYLDLSPEEHRYAEILHRYERSQDPQRSSLLKSEIEELRREKLRTHEHIESKTLRETSPEKTAEYYTDPNLQVLHMLLTIPKLSVQEERLATILGVTLDEIHRLTKLLMNLGLVEKNGKNIRVTELQLHLKDTSHLIRPYRKLLRMKALEKVPVKDDYSFSVLLSCDEKTRREANEILLGAVSQIKKLVSVANPEQVHQINIDLLRWF